MQRNMMHYRNVLLSPMKNCIKQWRIEKNSTQESVHTEPLSVPYLARTLASLTLKCNKIEFFV